MEQYILKNYEKGLKGILTEAQKTYSFLERNPKEYLGTRLITKNPIFRQTSFLKDLRSNELVIVDPITDNDWNLVVKGAHVNIEAYLKYFSRASGVWCTLRVLKPRLAIGRNVNFGGSVSGKGLTEISPSKNIKQLLDNIVAVLYDEVPFENSAYDYTEEEYIASTAISRESSTPIGKFIVRLSDEQRRDDSSVVINRELYGQLLGENEVFIWLRATTNNGKSTWVVAYPGLETTQKENIYVSDTFLVNLNCVPGEQITLSRGYLKTPESVRIRCRGTSDDVEFVKECMEKMSVLTVGATYLANDPNYETYFDVFYAGLDGVCTLRTRADIELGIVESLTMKLEPLAVTYDTTEEDEEDMY